MRKGKTEQKTLFAVHMFRVVLELFTTTFLTSHIISVDPNDIFGAGLINIGLFFIAEFITYIIIYLCISFWVGKSNRISFLRAGIVVYAIFLVVMVFYGKSIAEWVMIAGFLSGLSDAFIIQATTLCETNSTLGQTSKPTTYYQQLFLV